MRNAAVWALVCCWLLPGQVLLEGPRPGLPPVILGTDEAILESQETRTDLPCEVKPTKPKLGFDFAFYVGYELMVPLKELVGEGDKLSVIFRVTPEGTGNQPAYFSQQWKVPPLDENTGGSAELDGAFILGVGRYRVDWLMRDRAARVCSAHWTVSVDQRGKDRQIPLRVGPGVVRPLSTDLFSEGEPVERDSENALRALVLVHVAPQRSGAAGFGFEEIRVLLSILRNITQEPGIDRYSIMAFNFEQGAVIHRQEYASKIDFPALGDAVGKLQLGTVSIQNLQHRDAGRSFVAQALSSAIASDEPDVVIFVGAKRSFPSGDFNESLRVLGEPTCPVFYLSYDLTPDDEEPWRDIISFVVKFWKGIEYSITKPHDLFHRWATIMSRLSQHKARQTARSDEPIEPGDKKNRSESASDSSFPPKGVGEKGTSRAEAGHP
jgi:hypothetical protein